MKRLFMLLCAVVAFAACEQVFIDVANDVAESDRSLSVSFEGDDTRVQLNEAQKTVWTEGDLLSVFYRSTVNEKWQFMGKTGDRTGEIVPVDNSVNPPATHNRTVVVYPYNAGYFFNAETYSIEASMPAVQHYLKDSYGANGNIMVSSSEFNKVSLKSVCGWLKLQLTGEGEVVKSITLRGNDGEQVAGLIYVDSANAASTLASVMGEAGDEVGGVLVRPGTILNEVTLDCGEGVTLGAEATAFYIALPPQTFENGLTVDVRDVDGYLMTKSTTNEVVIERNTIQPMSEFKFEGAFPDNEIFYIATKKVEPHSGDWGANIVSNVWNEHTGEGVISFDGDVLQIPDRAFGNGITNAWLKSITIPSSVKVLGEDAFGGMSITQGVFENIVFAKGSQLEKVGSNAFKLNPSLKNIYLPDTVKEIGKGICFGCGALEGVYLSNDYYHNWHFGGASVLYRYEGNTMHIVVFPAVFSVNHQPSNVLAGATNLEYGAISMSNVERMHWWWFENIDSYNFANCDALSWVTLDRVETIGDYVLYMCDALREIDLPEARAIGSNCFTDNSVLKSISLGCDELETINYMGGNCPMLTTLHIPAGVTSITSSFNRCGALEEIFVKALVPPTLEDSFDSITDDATIYVPAESIRAYKRADGWSAFADNIVGYNFETGEIVESEPTPANNEILYMTTDGKVAEILEEYRAFGYFQNYDGYLVSNEYDDKRGVYVMTFSENLTVTPHYDGYLWGSYNLERVYLPDSITKIEYVFQQQHYLSTVNWPSNLKEIGNYTFFYCDGLTSVTLPDGVTTIGENAFRICYNLKSVTIPDSVKTIGYYAFEGCEGLTEFYCKAVTPPTIGEFVFTNTSSELKVYVPAGSEDAYRQTNRWSSYGFPIVGYDFETGEVVE